MGKNQWHLERDGWSPSDNVWKVDDPDLHGIRSDSFVKSMQLVAAVRHIVDQLASSSAGDDVMTAAADLVDKAADMLRGSSHRDGYLRAAEGKLTGLGPHGELGPFTGVLHVFAPNFAVEVIGEDLDRTVTGRVTYGSAYEGAPGLLQGGFIVATFDEILALVQAGSGRMTANIEVSYKSPAPLHNELVYRARLDRIEGRKAFVEGMLHHGNTLCATARGLFVAPRTVSAEQ